MAEIKKILKKLLTEAEKRNISVRDCGNGHIQLHGGPLLVNWYPLSRRQTAYVAGTKDGINWVSPEKAVQLCFAEPAVTHKPNERRKSRNRNGSHFRKLWERQGGLCWVCNKPMNNGQDKTDPMRATWEHRIPLARGGLDNFNNLALSHRRCNNERGHDMPELKGETNA